MGIGEGEAVIYDTLLSSNKKVMLHQNVCRINQWLFDNCSPECNFTMVARKIHKTGEEYFLGGFFSQGQYRLTTYERATNESARAI